MKRWADWWGVPFVMPPTHPNRTVLALRATLAADPQIPRASHALFHAYWGLGRDLSRPEVVREALDGAGLDGAALVQRAEDAAVKDALRARTDEAVARGVFGAPTMFVTVDGKTESFWGQDRLHFVEKALGGGPPPRRRRPTSPSSRAGRSRSSSISPVLSPTSPPPRSRRWRGGPGAAVRWKPFLLGALFKSIGTADVPLFTMPEPKRVLAGVDMTRWAAHHEVPFRFPSRFPMNSVKALRMVLQLPDAQKPPLVQAIFRAYWAEDRDIGADAELAAIAGSLGLDGAALVAGTKGDAVKARLKSATDEAERAGLCGAPSFLVKDQLFWGQDRLPFVERALQGWRPRGE